jgi:hypothetical protein
MSEIIREYSSQTELSKSNEAFDDFFSLVDRNSSKIELDDKSQDIITFLKRVGDTNIVRKFLDAKYDQINGDSRFDARKRVQLKQMI